MGGGDAISIQEVRRKTHRCRKEEGGETVKAGAVGGSGGVCGAEFYRAGGERTERGVVVPGRDVRLANCCNIWSLGPQTVLRFRLAS